MHYSDDWSNPTADNNDSDKGIILGCYFQLFIPMIDRDQFITPFQRDHQFFFKLYEVIKFLASNWYFNLGFDLFWFASKTCGIYHIFFLILSIELIISPFYFTFSFAFHSDSTENIWRSNYMQLFLDRSIRFLRVLFFFPHLHENNYFFE